MPASSTIGRALFPTAIGECGIAWGPQGIVAIALPNDNRKQTMADLARRAGGDEADPSLEITVAIERIAALLAGGDIDLADLAVDLSGMAPFHRRVLDLTRNIPRGATRTYGALAADLGDPLLARDVGQALGRNPVPVIIPCHRVMGTGEKLVGFSAPGGITTKRRLLAIEGVWPGGGPTLFDLVGMSQP